MQDQPRLLFDEPAAAPDSGAAQTPVPGRLLRYVQRSIREPLRDNPDFDTRLEGPDQGLINAWEAGRIKAKDDPDSAARARAGELLILPWKGGVEKGSKATKMGTLLYLAMWQGLRGEDLDIDTDAEPTLTCAATGTRVQYTADMAKILNAGGAAA